MSEPEAADLFSSSAYLLNDVVDIVAEIKHILSPVSGAFTTDQIRSFLMMLKVAATFDTSISEIQQQIITAVENDLLSEHGKDASW